MTAQSQSPLPTLHVDLVIDTICPWCYIGRSRLQKAVAQRPGLDIRIRIRSFLLNPNMPGEGMDQEDYMARRFGNEQRIARILDSIEEVGRREDIPFAFERITRAPNSLDSHRLLRLAANLGRQGEMADALYHAYFAEGRDIGDIWTLVDIASEVGFDPAITQPFLQGMTGVDDVLAENSWAHRQGINGVPAFLFEGGPALSGAHEPQVLLRLIDVAKELTATPPLSYCD
ncbi:DsbA family oxidoreductase [Magnetospira thiophila]